MAADLVLHVALLVARPGVGERVVEPVVRGEEPEEVAHQDPVAHAAADLGGVVEDGAPGRPADELEDVPGPLAHALGGLAPEDLGEADVRVREARGEVVPARRHAPDPEVGLPEVHLALSRQPGELEVAGRVPCVALGGHLLPAAPDVALHRGVAALVALLLAEPHVDAHGGVPLLAPVAAVVLEPRVDRGLVGREGRALRLRRPRRLGREVAHPDVLPDGGLGHPLRPGDPGDRLAPPRPPAYILYLVHADHSSPASLGRHRCNDKVRPPRGGRRAHAQTRKIFVHRRESMPCSDPQPRGYQTQHSGTSNG